MPATKSVSKNISNLAQGEHHGKRVKDQGKAGAHRQEIAIAYAEAKKAKGKPEKRKNVTHVKPGYPAKKKGK
jgi:hypothetical protein